MPAVFLAAIALRSAEWLLRKWGAFELLALLVFIALSLPGATYYVTVWRGTGGSQKYVTNLLDGRPR